MAKLDLNVLAKKNDDQMYQIIEFNGEIDKSNIDDIRQVLTKYIDSFELNALIFDLTYFDFINSEGVGLMVSFFYRMQKSGKKLVFVNAQPQVEDVFNLVGLTNVIELYDNIESAINKIS